jgi:predicted extracellular nuclease/phosphodiesterase/alkaline phosphatase D-like protein
MSATYHSLAGSNFAQEWSNNALLTQDDDWSGVPSIIGYRGDDLAASTGVDPQTVLGDGTNPGVVDVIVNQSSPTSLTTGGVAEFDGLADRVVALNGSGTADAPFLVIHLDATGRENVTVQFNARDLDASSDNAIQQVAVQYRLGASGDWTNVPSGFIADATTGPNTASLVTAVNVTLPSDANNQAQLQVRIITTNAVGSDEWVGIDDILVSSAPLSAAVVLQSLTVAPTSALEDTGSFTVTATLSAAALTDTVVSLSYSLPTELASPPATVTILAGETTGSVTVFAAADTVFEANEPMTVTATLGATQRQAALTILNDDPAPSDINGIDILPVADSTLTGSTTTPTASNALNVKKLASFATTNDAGTAVGLGGAESIAFDATTKKAFVTNAALDRIDIIDLSNPAAPAKLSPIDLKVLTGYGEVNSVAISKGIVAVAVQNVDGTQPGVVALFNSDGVLQKTLSVGVLPDQLTFTSNGLLVVANEAEATSATSNPSGSVTIIDVSGGAAAATVRNTIDFTALDGNEAALSANGIKIFSGQSASADMEPEYVAISADGTKAYVTLQEVNTVAVIDLTDAAATKPISLLPLGFVNHTLAGNEGDFSDRDGAGNATTISINTTPLKGLLQPDALATFAVGGLTYFITANEGDARVGSSLGDEVRASAAPFSVTDTDYARVNVNTTFSTPGDLYSFGGRGFSIFRDNGDGTFTKVEESGGEFEKIIAAQTPSEFNADAGAANTFDTRSDNKGPEPEGVDIAVIDGRTYAFIGLERGNGLMVYDVTNPSNASFVRYVPFSGGDSSPEVLKVISSADSPTGRPLILSANEVSGTVAIYEIVAPQIASGAIDQDSIILWGKATATGTATFEVATDAAFSNILTGLTQNVVVTDVDIPAKVEVAGLTSNTQYYYRFSDGVATSEVGTFSTAGSIADGKLGLHFGVSGDWRGELAPYPSISNADTAGLKFFVALGDTIYADYPSPRVPSNQATTLDEFRAKHDEVYSDRYGVNTFGDLRANTSILATIDDHEVTNDFQGGALASSDPRFAGAPVGALVNETDLYKKGLQAFTEYNPIAEATYSGTGDARFDGRPKLYATETFGKDAATFMLDLRSFRDQGLVDADISNAADVGRFLSQSFDPSRTMLGNAQLEELKADLLAADEAGVTWKFVYAPEPVQNLGPLAASDRFEGYAAERAELLKFIEDNEISNVVFVTADLHGSIVNNLTYQTGLGQPQIATGAFEVITGSVAFDAPFGQTVGDLAAQLGLLSPQQSAFYNSLPVAADTDAVLNDKDDFIESLINSQISAFGYDPIGLDNNLAQASGRINATLVSGDYLAAHTYGWTDFKIDQATQKLTVTTYGIPPYSEAELLANPAAVTARTPTIVSQFTVDAQQTVTRIFDIQGSGATSALVGQTVTTRGIVTAVDTNGSRGFWIQDASGDGDANTSDGIFVFLGGGPALPTVGDLVSVTGRVGEFTPSGAAPGSLSVTQLSSVTNVSTLLAASLADDVSSVVIGGPGGLLPPTESIAQGVAFWEKFEGMQVTIKQAIAVGPTNNFGEIYTVVDNDGNPANGTSATGQTARGNVLLTPGAESFGNTDTVGGDFNPERIQIDDDSGVVAGFASPRVDVGARLGDVTGVVGYNFGNYEVVATSAFTVSQASPLVKETSTLTGDAENILIASYNAENLSPNDLASGKFDTIAAEIFNTLNRPDIVALQEIQDNDGATNSTVTSASVTLQTLVDKINALAATAGSTAHYSFLDNPFIVDDANGGQPGGNIRNAYLYRDDRVSFVADSLKTIDASGNAITANGDQATSVDNPFFSSRLPLIATFTFAGEEVSVINNHFTSKGGSGALMSTVEPPLNGGEVQRAGQAQAVNNFVDSLLAADANARVVVAGDLNEFPFEQPISVLKGTASISNYDVPGTDPINATATYTPGGTQILQDAGPAPRRRALRLRLRRQFPDTRPHSRHERRRGRRPVRCAPDQFRVRQSDERPRSPSREVEHDHRIYPLLAPDPSHVWRERHACR